MIVSSRIEKVGRPTTDRIDCNKVAEDASASPSQTLPLACALALATASRRLRVSTRIASAAPNMRKSIVFSSVVAIFNALKKPVAAFRPLRAAIRSISDFHFMSIGLRQTGNRMWRRWRRAIILLPEYDMRQAVILHERKYSLRLVRHVRKATFDFSLEEQWAITRVVAFHKRRIKYWR